MKNQAAIVENDSGFQKSNKTKRLVYGSLVIVWMLVIFFYSAQDGTKSGSSSSEITYFILDLFTRIGLISACNYTQQQITDFEGWIRTIAHFTEYFIFGILALQFVRYSFAKKPVVGITGSFLFCIIYAVTDEFHQYFVPGRAMQLEDWLVDMLGVFCGIMLFTLFTKSHNDKNNGTIIK